MSEDLRKAYKCVDLMNEVMGFDVRERLRDSKHSWARNMLVYKLLDYKLTLEQIGEVISRDHSTVVNCRLQSCLAMEAPKLYPDAMDIWNRFNERLSLEKNRYYEEIF